MKIPPTVRKGDPVRASDYNNLLAYVRMLTLRSGVGYRVDQTAGGTVLKISKGRGGGGGGGASHPFQLSLGASETSTTILQCSFGITTGPTWTTYGYEDYLCTSSWAPGIGYGYLIGDPNDPDGTDAGFIEIAPNTTAGIWIQAVARHAWSPNNPAGTVGDWYQHEWQTVDSGGAVVADTTHTEIGSGADIAADNPGYAFQYIGKVVTDAAGAATITQYLRSDVFWPIATFPRFIISGDTPNGLTRSENDRGIIYDDSDNREVGDQG